MTCSPAARDIAGTHPCMRFGTPACFMNIVSGAKHRPPPIELANEKTCWSRAGWCSSAHRSRVGGLFWPVLLWECRMLPWAAFGRGSSRPYTIVPLRLASRGLQCRCLLRWVGAPLVDLSSARFLTSLRPCRLLLEWGPNSKNVGECQASPWLLQSSSHREGALEGASEATAGSAASTPRATATRAGNCC